MTMDEVSNELKAMMNEIKGWWLDDVRVTIMVRNPDRMNANMVVTDDDALDIINVVLGDGLEEPV